MPGPDDILQRMLQQNPVVRNNPNNAPILIRWPAELLSVLRLLSHGKKV